MTRVNRSKEAIAIPREARPEGRFVANMAQMREKPVLFVDIDGVISLCGSDSNARPAGAFHNVDGVMHFLSSDAANPLLAFHRRFALAATEAYGGPPT